MKFYPNFNLPCLVDISTKGVFIDHVSKSPIHLVKVAYLPHISINNKLYACADIMWRMFIGEDLGKIRYRNGNFNDISIKNLYIDITLSRLDVNTFIINGIYFKRIPNFSKYAISENGCVYSLKRNIFIIRNFNYSYYPTVSIVDDSGFRSPRKVHRLVYSTFIGDLLDGYVIDHCDGNKQNPNKNNLEQVKQSENFERACDMGLFKKRWTDEEISLICKLLGEYTPTHTILEKLNKNTSEYRDMTMLIHLLRNGKIYKNITKNYNISNIPTYLNKKDRKFSPDDISQIRTKLSLGYRVADLAHKYKCAPITISNIRDRKVWK